MAKEFNPGDSAFTVDGQAVTFIAKVGDGFCVRPLYEDEEGEPYEDGTPIIVNRLYAEPPTEQRNQQVADLDAKIQAKRDELDGLQTAVRVTEGEMRSRLALIKQHKSLEFLEDFIAGRITHLVEKGFGEPRIVDFDKAILPEDVENNCYPRKVKLLSLFGAANGDLEWKLNRYSDGSGGYTDVYLCRSMDEARAKLAELIHEEAQKDHGFYYFDRWQKVAAQHGLEIPAAVLKAKLGEEIAGLEKQTNDAAAVEGQRQERISRLKSEIAAIN